MGALGVSPPDIAPRATHEIPADGRDDRAAGRTRQRLRGRGACAVLVPSDPDYGALSRRDRDADDRRRPGRGRALQARSRRLRAVEAELRTASIGWDSPWGRGRPGWHIECSAMIARASGRDHRHPRRRARPHLPAPRERDRAEPLRPRRRAARPLLGAQRLPRHGRREDVEVARQCGHAERAAGAGPQGRDAAAGAAVRALPPAAAVDGRADRAVEGDARPVSIARLATPSRARLMRAWSMPCPTISIRRWRCRGCRRIDDPATPSQRAAQLLGLLGDSAEALVPGRRRRGRDRSAHRRATAAKASRDFATADRIREELKAEGIVARRRAGRDDLAAGMIRLTTLSFVLSEVEGRLREDCPSALRLRAEALRSGRAWERRNERTALHDRNLAAGGVAPSLARWNARTALPSSVADLRQPVRTWFRWSDGRVGLSASRFTPARSVRPRRRSFEQGAIGRTAG